METGLKVEQDGGAGFEGEGIGRTAEGICFWRSRGSVGVGKTDRGEHGTKAREESHLQAEMGEGSEVGSG